MVRGKEVNGVSRVAVGTVMFPWAVWEEAPPTFSVEIKTIPCWYGAKILPVRGGKTRGNRGGSSGLRDGK